MCHADIARGMSQCPSKGAGGRVGWILPGMADSAIEQAVLDKPVGSITQVESSAGFHLFEVLAESTTESTTDAGQKSGPAGSRGARGASLPAQQQRSPIASASVQQLADVLNDPAKVHLHSS